MSNNMYILHIYIDMSLYHCIPDSFRMIISLAQLLVDPRVTSRWFSLGENHGISGTQFIWQQY